MASGVSYAGYHETPNLPISLPHGWHRAFLMLTSLGLSTSGAILALHLSFLCIRLSSFCRLIYWDIRQNRGLTIARVLSFVTSLTSPCVLCLIASLLGFRVFGAE
jgi:hypothetical protein